MRALVIEDDFTSRRYLQRLLLKWGECDAAANGSEGVQAFWAALEEGRPYDLLCLDIMMPEMDGHEVLRIIRRMEKFSGKAGEQRSRVIITSALADGKNVAKAALEQCDAYLVKPIDGNKLCGHLRAFNLISGDTT